MFQNRNVMVTGATGFIGKRLVARLVSNGNDVTCLVRSTSETSELQLLKNCSFVYGDVVKNPDAVAEAAANADTVFHLAASTHAVNSRDLIGINTTGIRNVLQACTDSFSTPTVVFVSSLAAVGPSTGSQPHLEGEPRNPVSWYGRSKAASELVACEFANRLPISIVRPPIVLGGGDRHGVEMFSAIDKLGFHFVPGYFSRWYFSVIHVDDLVDSLLGVAEHGERLVSEVESKGIYFASPVEPVTYSELGKLIGTALGRRHTQIIRVGKPFMWLVALANEIRGRISGSPKYLNLDKCREAFAGSWACSGSKLNEEIGFASSATLLQRLEQTASWYREHGWLGSKERGGELYTASAAKESHSTKNRMGRDLSTS